MDTGYKRYPPPPPFPFKLCLLPVVNTHITGITDTYRTYYCWKIARGPYHYYYVVEFADAGEEGGYDNWVSLMLVSSRQADAWKTDRAVLSTLGRVRLDQVKRRSQPREAGCRIIRHSIYLQALSFMYFIFFNYYYFFFTVAIDIIGGILVVMI